MFLKPKSGSSTYLEDSPDHLPDIGLFKLYDVILGPLEVIPLKGKKMDVPGYPQFVEHYNSVKSLARESLV